MANEQISEITTAPTNATVIKIINALIKRYNSLGSIYTFKGSVQTYDDLLAIQNPNVGDVYNVVQEDEEHQIAAGSNFVWDGTVWDNLGGSLAGLVQSVNGINPDSLGNVLLPLIKNITTNQGVLTFKKNDNTTIQVDNIKKLYMSTLGENVNLNDLMESGIYICASNAYAANYENCPIQKAFLLEVQTLNDGTNKFVYQFLTQYHDGSTEAGNQYTRTYYHNHNWSVWTQMAKQSDLTDLSNSVVKSVNGVTPTGGDVDINRKFYNSLAQLGLNYDTVTFDQIANTLPVNSTLTFYVDIVTSQPTYAPNLAIPVSGSIVVTKGINNVVPIKFTLSPIANNATTYLGEYTTYNSYGFKGWKPVVLSVNGAKPNYTGNVTIDIPEPVIASEAEAKAGTNNTKFMTPLRVKQAIDALAESGSWTISKGTNGWARENTTGFTIQWWVGNTDATYRSITYPRSFSTLYYANVIASSNCETFVTGVSNTSISFCLCNGYNDDRWSGSQPCRLYACGLT